MVVSSSNLHYAILFLSRRIGYFRRRNLLGLEMIHSCASLYENVSLLQQCEPGGQQQHHFVNNVTLQFIANIVQKLLKWMNLNE
jgi:hypothetical protein